MDLQLRPVQAADAKAVWEINSQPAVRAVSLSQEQIPWERHLGWFERLLTDPGRRMFLAESQGHSAGVVRFDVLDECTAEVSVALAAHAMGKRLGRHLIRKGTLDFLRDRPGSVVWAHVKPDNLASRKAFAAAGYRLLGDFVWKGQELERYVFSRPRLILGTAQFGLDYGINNTKGKPPVEEIAEILARSRERGVWCLDTAEAYGDANERLASIFSGLPESVRENYKIIAKFHLEPGQRLAAKAEELADTFGAERLWCFQFHRFADVPADGAGLSELRDRAELAGVSLYTNEELEKAMQLPHLDVFQLPYNLLDNRSQRGAVFARARAKGKMIHARSVFLQGLFFKDRLPGQLEPLAEPLGRLRDIAAQCFPELPAHERLVRLALGYVVDDPELDGVLLGLESLEQWNELDRHLDVQIPPEARAALDDLRVERADLLNPSLWSGG